MLRIDTLVLKLPHILTSSSHDPLAAHASTELIAGAKHSAIVQIRGYI
jgi:hypothetical protein